MKLSNVAAVSALVSLLVLSGCAANTSDEAVDATENAIESCANLSGTYELVSCTGTGDGALKKGLNLPDAPPEALSNDPYYAPMLEYLVLPTREVKIAQTACGNATFSADFPTFRSSLERSNCALYGDCAPGWDDPTGTKPRTKAYGAGTTQTALSYSQSGFQDRTITFDRTGLSVTKGYPGLASPFAQRRNSSVDPYGYTSKTTFRTTASGLEVTSSWGNAVRWRSNSFSQSPHREGTQRCTLKKRP